MLVLVVTCRVWRLNGGSWIWGLRAQVWKGSGMAGEKEKRTGLDEVGRINLILGLFELATTSRTKVRVALARVDGRR